MIKRLLHFNYKQQFRHTLTHTTPCLLDQFFDIMTSVPTHTFARRQKTFIAIVNVMLFSFCCISPIAMGRDCSCTVWGDPHFIVRSYLFRHDTYANTLIPIPNTNTITTTIPNTIPFQPPSPSPNTIAITIVVFSPSMDIASTSKAVVNSVFTATKTGRFNVVSGIVLAQALP